MRGFLKFVLFSLISLTSLNAGYFDGKSIQFFRDAISRSFPPAGSEKKEASFISSQYLRIGDDIYSATLSDTVAFNTALKSNSGFFFQKQGDTYTSLYHYDSSNESIDLSCQGNTCQGIEFYQKYPQAYKKVTFSYYSSYALVKVATCPSDQNFNSNTGQCQKCKDNESWNPKTNSCFIDCTDEKTNKYGWEDGSCTDCSAAKTTGEIYRCFCGSLGLGVPETFPDVGVIGKPGYFMGQCSNGYSFEYKDPDYKPDPKPDDNKTKPDNPKPNPDDPKPDPGGNSGGGNPGGGSGGGNNGGSQDNPNPNPGGGTGDNPDPKPNPNPGGGSGGGGNGDKDKDKDGDAKFNPGDFDYSDKKGEYEDFKNRYGEALDKVLENFDGFKQGVDQFISNVQGKGLASADKQSKPTTCVKKYDIDFFGYNSSIEFDFCKVASMVSGAFYYIFYAFFFYCFLILIVKILLFAF